jgi:hypothetical protein
MYKKIFHTLSYVEYFNEIHHVFKKEDILLLFPSGILSELRV